MLSTLKLWWWRRGLDSPQPARRERALRGLASVGELAPVVRAVLQEATPLRAVAQELLRRAGPLALYRSGASKTFLDAMQRPSNTQSVGRLLLSIRAIPILVEGLIYPDAAVKQLAAALLEELDPAWPSLPETRLALPALVMAAASDRSFTPAAAREVLARMPGDPLKYPEAAEAVPQLVTRLRAEDASVRSRAVRLLAGIGGPIAEAAIRGAASDPAVGPANEATEALARLGGPENFARLLELSTDSRPHVRPQAIEGLTRLRADWRTSAAATDAGRRWAECARDRTQPSAARTAAVRGLTALADRCHLDVVLGAACEADGNIAIVAMEGLASFSDWGRTPEAAAAVSGLIAGLTGPGHIAISRTAVLAAIGDRRAVMPIIPLLSDKSLTTRADAAEALGKLGDARAVEPLCRLLFDEYPRVVKAGARALQQIDPGYRNSGPVRTAARELARWLNATPQHSTSEWLNRAWALAQIGDYSNLDERLLAGLSVEPDRVHTDLNRPSHVEGGVWVQDTAIPETIFACDNLREAAQREMERRKGRKAT